MHSSGQVGDGIDYLIPPMLMVRISKRLLQKIVPSPWNICFLVVQRVRETCASRYEPGLSDAFLRRSRRRARLDNASNDSGSTLEAYVSRKGATFMKLAFLGGAPFSCKICFEMIRRNLWSIIEASLTTGSPPGCARWPLLLSRSVFFHKNGAPPRNQRFMKEAPFHETFAREGEPGSSEDFLRRAFLRARLRWSWFDSRNICFVKKRLLYETSVSGWKAVSIKQKSFDMITSIIWSNWQAYLENASDDPGSHLEAYFSWNLYPSRNARFIVEARCRKTFACNIFIKLS